MKENFFKSSREKASDLLDEFAELLKSPLEDKYNSIKNRLISIASGAITDDTADYLLRGCKTALTAKNTKIQTTAQLDVLKKEEKPKLKPFNKK